MTTTATTGRPQHKPDEADRELLNQLQAGLALVREPYAEIGSRIGMDEEEVLRRLARLKDAAIVRQLSAIFDTRALGYTSSLVAARYPDDRLFEDLMDVARHALGRAREGVASALWVAATPGLDDLPEEVVEAKLAALVAGARQARLYLAKEQFEL